MPPQQRIIVLNDELAQHRKSVRVQPGWHAAAVRLRYPTALFTRVAAPVRHGGGTDLEPTGNLNLAAVAPLAGDQNAFAKIRRIGLGHVGLLYHIPVNAQPASPDSSPDQNRFSFPTQWQLGPGTGINATPLYEEYTGACIRIALVDTGLDYANPDFSGRLDLQNDYDGLNHDNDTNNVGGDQHGTEVGLILAAAANNGFDRVSAAFGATLVPYRFDTRSLRTVEQETTLLQLQDQVDVSHNSWSHSGEFFRDNFGDPAYAAAATAIAHEVTAGRGGLGTIIVRSAGNDGQLGDDVNTHNYLNNHYSIAVGASAQDGTVQSFSNPGAALTVVAPGTATSWAAPLASATAALVLQANPQLGYRDVATILALTARITDPAGAGWFTNGGSGWNGGGLHVSGKAGLGLIDAQAAVRLSEAWTAQSTEANLLQVQANGSGAAVIPDQGSVSQTVQIAENLQVERAEVDTDIAHAKIGDLRLVLVSPSGTGSVLLRRADRSSISFFVSQTSVGQPLIR